MFSPLKADSGLLVAFEGLDQSGKQTQAELLRERLISNSRTVQLLSFPDYQTMIGAEIGRALRGEREYTADVAGWSALVLRERRRSPRDPREGLTMLLSREPVELRVR